jgi:HPt (histidine-containing phosphotransfer) domain-containing protein
MILPYGTAIQQAAASGDLAQMKAAARQAEEHLREWGDVSASLAALKIEIAKLESKRH